MLKKVFGVVFILLLLQLSLISKEAIAGDQENYAVTGFRNLKFGLSEDQVRKALISEFKIKDNEIKRMENPIEGTVLLSAKLNNLEYGPGEAVLHTTFGHQSKKLIQVNVVWESSTSSEEAQNAFGAAAMRFSQYFNNFKWKEDGIIKMQAAGDNAVTVFAARDNKHGAVKVILDGVQYEGFINGQHKKSQVPKTPLILQIVYLENYDNPDIIRLPAGSF